MCLIFGYKPTHVYKHEKQVDYSKYLGPNWRENKFKGKRVSTQVANHVGIIDIFLCSSHGQYCSYTPSDDVKKFQGLSLIMTFYTDAVQCVYVDRGGA